MNYLNQCYQISRAFTISSEQIRRMPPIHDKPTTDRYDYVVIGGGSGGSGTSVSNSFALLQSSLWVSNTFLWDMLPGFLRVY